MNGTNLPHRGRGNVAALKWTLVSGCENMLYRHGLGKLSSRPRSCPPPLMGYQNHPHEGCCQPEANIVQKYIEGRVNKALLVAAGGTKIRAYSRGHWGSNTPRRDCLPVYSSHHPLCFKWRDKAVHATLLPGF